VNENVDESTLSKVEKLSLLTGESREKILNELKAMAEQYPELKDSPSDLLILYASKKGVPPTRLETGNSLEVIILGKTILKSRKSGDEYVQFRAVEGNGKIVRIQCFRPDIDFDPMYLWRFDGIKKVDDGLYRIQATTVAEKIGRKPLNETVQSVQLSSIVEGGEGFCKLVVLNMFIGNSRRCPGCGGKVAGKFCPKCGKKVEPETVDWTKLTVSDGVTRADAYLHYNETASIGDRIFALVRMWNQRYSIEYFEKIGEEEKEKKSEGESGEQSDVKDVAATVLNVILKKKVSVQEASEMIKNLGGKPDEILEKLYSYGVKREGDSLYI
jgi:hypothetical protein